MLRVLILAYHFPPSNCSAAYRPAAWVQYGKNLGFYPTVVTRHWQGLENEWMNFETDCGDSVTCDKTENSEIIRLPYRNRQLKKSSILSRNKLLRKAYYFFKTITGNFHTQANIDDTYKKFLFDLLAERKFDVIVVTVPPYQLVQLAMQLSSKFKIPFVTDIRDLWNENKCLKTNRKWTAKDLFNEKISRFYIFKWIKSSSLVTVVSNPMIDAFPKKMKLPFLELTNGFDAAMYENAEVKPGDKFTLTLTGTIYPEQNFDVLLKGFQGFLSGRPNAVINFIGINLFPEIENKVRQMLPAESIVIKPRISKKQVVELTLSSHVLFYAGWEGYRGFYTGKIFEYLAARKNILIAPGDHDVIDGLIKKTKAGVCADSSSEVTAILNNWYHEWERNGNLHYSGIEEEINRYSREQLTREFARKLNIIVAKQAVG
jgi:glycosyltransferase involved in cell wall biosynthesis